MRCADFQATQAAAHPEAPLSIAQALFQAAPTAAHTDSAA